MIPVYLSEVKLRKVQDVYAVHQLLKEAAPSEARILFRGEVESHPDGRPGLGLLVQTQSKPDWTALPEGVLERAPRSKPVAWELTEGRTFRFRLRANVTRQRKGRSEPSTEALEGAAYRAARGKRVAIWKEDEQRAWLIRKAEAAGFALVELPITTESGDTENVPSLLLGKHVDAGQGLTLSSRAERATQRRTRHAMRFDGVNFDGYLRVVDPGALERALREGIGPGKAFGFGLLTLARG